MYFLPHENLERFLADVGYSQEKDTLGKVSQETPIVRAAALSNRAAFIRSLKRHPGVSVAFGMTLLGVGAGLTRHGQQPSLAGALFGAGVASLVWIPVLWTAWAMRRT